MKEDNLRLVLLGLAGILILGLPLVIMQKSAGIVSAGFIGDYLSILMLLFLSPFIVPMSVLLWEFDMFAFSVWYMLLFWTIPPIAIGMGTSETLDIKNYGSGYVMMLMVTIFVLFIGILAGIATL